MSRRPKVFDVGVRTLFTWEKKLREQGHLERKKRVAKSRKIPLEELKAFVEAHQMFFYGKLRHILIVLFLQYGQL